MTQTNIWCPCYSYGCWHVRICNYIRLFGIFCTHNIFSKLGFTPCQNGEAIMTMILLVIFFLQLYLKKT